MGLWRWLRRLVGEPGGSVAGIEHLVVGLGNPGEGYRATRHNVGYEVVGELATRWHGGPAWRMGGAEVVRCDGLEFGACALVKPLLFMNRSGDPVQRVLSASGCAVESCIVVVDDVNLALGRIRVRRGGSDGGHNGLKSLIAAIGDGFPRVRVGVGPVPRGESLVDFVLGRFGDDEVAAVGSSVRRAADAVQSVVAEDVDSAMGRFNG